MNSQCYGHRGMGCSIPGTLSAYPENSIASFKEALEHEVNGVELDVFLSGLDEVVVCHGASYNGVSGIISLNCLNNIDNEPHVFDPSVTCENVKVPHNRIYLKRPWVLGTFSGIEKCSRNIPLTYAETVKAAYEYIESRDIWSANDRSPYETLPVLDDVFGTFGSGLSYNVELKGNRPELGPRVLEIISRYKNLDVLISSFNWTPPELDADSPLYNNEIEKSPNCCGDNSRFNKDNCDLLEPLIGNKLGVKLGLLFTGSNESLPSIPRIIECAKKYNATFINVQHDFWKKDVPILGEDVNGEESLKYFVDVMHEHRLQVLTYWTEAPDDIEDYKLHLRNNVDIICPNHVKEAMELLKSGGN